jgi:general secretion pathway protein G
MFLKFRKLYNKGFTLIELLVVISIIAMLSSIVISSLGDARKRAMDTATLESVRQVKTALNLYSTDYGGFPPSIEEPVTKKYINSVLSSIMYSPMKADGVTPCDMGLCSTYDLKVVSNGGSGGSSSSGNKVLGATCVSNSECADGYCQTRFNPHSCTDGSTNSNCSTNIECRSGFCYQNAFCSGTGAMGDSCQVHADCLSGICQDSFCACTSSDCEPFRCSGWGVCTDGNFGSVCGDDFECNSPLTCDGMNCY